MDSGRRGHRTVIDPKVRQVGFVTPGADLGSKGGTVERDAVAGPAGGLPLDGGSPSPVIIPPPVRLADLKSVPVSVPSPKRYPSLDLSLPPGSFNPPDAILGSLTSPSTGVSKGASNGESESLQLSSTTIEDLPKRVTAESLPAGSGMAAPLSAIGKGAGQQLVSSLVTGSVPAEPEGTIGKIKSPSRMAPDEKAQKSLKERTSKAERRAAQEAQRAAKAAAKEAGGLGQVKPEAPSHSSPQKETKVSKISGPKEFLQRKSSTNSEQRSAEGMKAQDKKKKKDVPPPRMQFDDEQQVAKAKKRSLVEQTETKNRVELFRHLPQFVHGTMLHSLEAKFFREEAMHPHPAVYKVGLQYLTGDIVGGNARCVAMLMAFREMIEDYTTPPEKIFVRDLTGKINSNVSFLITCRPLAISMGNAIKFLKTRVVSVASSLSEAEAKANLIGDIDRFISDKIFYADKEIVKHAVQKIRDGDVCLTYGSSSVVEMIFMRAHELGRKFRVVVIDSRPKLEGRRLLKRLLQEGIQCTYTSINGVSYIMHEVTRVFLGAASVLSNGTVYSRVGTASVAMVAHAFSVPVIICCETYKFHERVQLDSITANELGDPDVLVKVWGRCDLKELEGWADDTHLQLLNLTYDATPSDYVSMIITELGMVPPTSVPVILREYRRDPPT